MFVIIFDNTFAQLDIACISPAGNAYSDSCVQANIIPPVTAGNWITECLYFKPATEYVNLGYILINSTCGPVSPYNQLFFNLYNFDCDTLITSGQIHPVASNTSLFLDTSRTYLICYTWKAKCTQFSFCPIITSSALPVEWLYLRIEYNAQEKITYIDWATASETNCFAFIVEKTDNLFKWVEVATVSGNGSTTMTHNYTVTDFFPTSGSLYRIKQRDYNGRITYSKAISLHYTEKYTDCIFYNILGQYAGLQENNLPSGVYLRQCGDKYKKFTTKVIIVR
ncbi:MAG TPA: hypothetical protein VJY62_07285 [Bacteroidia bacterium]|nr:hypothetical protein [Bacteroidia bacterium]